MHSTTLVTLALWAIAAATAVAEPLPVETGTHSAPIASFYPAAALAAGIGGEATLFCERTAGGALANCRLSEEQPVGQGFGAAALALASKSANGCGTPLPQGWSGTSHPIRFTFQPSPVAIEPDPRLPGWTLTKAVWRKTPTGDDFVRVYPKRALDENISGAAVVQCIAGPDGRLTKCQAIAESPAGFEFGKAALALSKLFAFDRTTCSGHFAGASIVIPIQFHVYTQ